MTNKNYKENNININIKNTYENTKKIGLKYNIKCEDCLNLTYKIWNLHRDPFIVKNGSILTLLTIHYNLSLGTIAHFKKERKDLDKLISDYENFNVFGQYMLTELGYGNNVYQLKTTSTWDEKNKIIHLHLLIM